jgi:hypothetical protein
VLNSNTVDYFALKKALSKFYDFKFRAPVKSRGKNFSPQQKSTITRRYNKIKQFLNDDFSVDIKHISWIKYPPKSRLANVDGVRTHKGIFYKHKNSVAKQLKNKKGLPSGKWVVLVNPKVDFGTYEVVQEERRDVFIPFPKGIRHDLEKIKKYVDRWVERLRPAEVMWSYKDTKSKVQFDPTKFDLYLGGGDSDYTEVKNLIDHVVKKNRNLLSTDKEKFERAKNKFVASETYGLLDRVEREDFWAGLNFRRTTKRDDFEYNGVFFIYYL